MPPVRQQGSNEDIGHARQEIRLGKYFIMVADPVEKGGLRKKDQKGKDGVQEGDPVKDGVQAPYDQPVQVIIFRVQDGRHGVQEHGKFQDQGIYRQ